MLYNQRLKPKSCGQVAYGQLSWTNHGRSVCLFAFFGRANRDILDIWVLYLEMRLSTYIIMTVGDDLDGVCCLRICGLCILRVVCFESVALYRRPLLRVYEVVEVKKTLAGLKRHLIECMATKRQFQGSSLQHT